MPFNYTVVALHNPVSYGDNYNIALNNLKKTCVRCDSSLLAFPDTVNDV